MDNKRVKVGLVGFGIVGSGVAKILLENAAEIQARTGVSLELACVVDTDMSRTRPVTLPAGLLTNDLNRMLNDRTIDIGVELVGGTGFARQLHHKILESGKHVVTANKALLAEHGPELYAAARAAKKCIAFEASCCGGIPIISAIRTGLAANRITALYGILNGTCNYILSNMTLKNMDFASALRQAQEKGYAEADPKLDINGSDSAHKLTVLASLAFGCEIPFSSVYIEGIEGVRIEDIQHGLEMGYVIKLLAIGQRDPQGKISLRVHPSFISKNTPLARVNGPFNAVSIFGHAVGNTLYFGRGAGMMPTASAVVADLIEVALGNSQTLFDTMRWTPADQTRALLSDIGAINSRFYIKVMAKDRPGVVAAYGKILGDHNISISGALQHEGLGPENSVPVVITTHPTQQKNMVAALDQFQKLDVVCGKPVCIRILDIPEDSE
jgi:homoserine dehydrogenase